MNKNIDTSIHVKIINLVLTLNDQISSGSLNNEFILSMIKANVTNWQEEPLDKAHDTFKELILLKHADSLKHLDTDLMFNFLNVLLSHGKEFSEDQAVFWYEYKLYRDSVELIKAIAKVETTQQTTTAIHYYESYDSNGIMKRCDYRVGKSGEDRNHILHQLLRQIILSPEEIYDCPEELLTMDKTMRYTFVKDYIEEMIYKMSEQTYADYSVAINHWNNDLSYLRTLTIS